MRQIKFRGKNLRTNEWLYGDLHHEMEDMVAIRTLLEGTPQTVDENTVGQYVGLKDRNGKEIYEGDIVKFHFMTFDACASKLFPTQKLLGEITTNKYNQWCIMSDGMEIHIENAVNYGIVIGNIHDEKKMEEMKKNKAATILDKYGINRDDKFRYQLLARMKDDCDYYLGYGDRCEKYLWAGNAADQIAIMCALWHSLRVPPGWMTLEQIDEYAKQMTT